MLTIALHPTDVPISVTMSGTTHLDVCAANIDGSLADGSWPAHNFAACIPVDSARSVALPSTHTSANHVAFALRARTTGVVEAATVSYVPGDAFLQVVPPPGRGDGMVVGFTPSSPTIEAQAFALPDYGNSPGIHLSVEQQRQAITAMGPCSFPSEISSCFTGVRAGTRLAVTLHGAPPQNTAVALYVGWWP
jgi:hypothetical protein